MRDRWWKLTDVREIDYRAKLRNVALKVSSSGRDHAVPKFEGARSRGHQRRDIRHLRLSAIRVAKTEGA